jgi:hypothetical protein
MVSGFLYILSNAAIPGMLKIGKTTVAPQQRAEELWTTGVPLPFRIEEVFRVEDVDKAESSVHRILDNARVHPQREFFELSLESALEYILPALGKRMVDINDAKELLKQLPVSKRSSEDLARALDLAMEQIKKYGDSSYINRLVTDKEIYSTMSRKQRIDYALERLPDWRWDAGRNTFFKKIKGKKDKPPTN